MGPIARRRFVLSGLAALTSSAALAACAPSAPTAAPKAAAPPTSAPAAAPPTAAAQTKLSLALVPSENAQEQARQWGDYFKWLEKRLDVKIENFIATDYTAVIEAMRAKHIEAA